MAGHALELARSRMLEPIGGRRRDALTQASAGRWTNTINAQGSDVDSHAHTTYAPPAQRVRSEIDALIEFSGMAHRIVHREPDDAIREGLDLGATGSKPGEVIPVEVSIKRPILKALAKLGTLENIADGRRWGRAYGGGAVVMIVDDGETELWDPIDFSQLRAVRHLFAFDRHEIRPEDSGHARLGMPLHYQLTGRHGALRLHESRVIPFIGTKLPLRIREIREFWGGSVIDLVWAELRNWGSSHEYATEAIALLTQGVFRTKHLNSRIDAGDADKVADRLEALRIGMGVLGDINIDMDEEDYQVVARSIAGLGEALDKLNEALVAATDMPTSVLMGKTPGGLNSGENAGEIRSWYDHVRVKQTQIYGPAVERVLELVMRSKDGPTRGQLVDVVPVFPPLWQEDETTKVANRKSRAEARKIDVDAFIVAADEARQDPDLADVYQLDTDEPAPEKPEETGGFFNTDEDGEPLPELIATALDDMPKGEALLSAKDAAERLGTKPRSLRTMHAKGKINAARINGRWHYAWSQIRAAIQTGG